MSIKILIFGQDQLLTKFLEKSQGAHSIHSEETVIVKTVFVADYPYLLFAVKDRALVAQQATGTNGLLFFIGGDTPLFEEKQYLLDLIASRTEFEGVPLAVIFEKGQQLSLKDVVNYLELYRLKERASMIKQISWEQHDWIAQVYGWVKTQSDLLGRGRNFQAAPKVVKLKPKYREQVQQESQKKYEGMLGQQDVREKAVKAQQEVYIEREKQRLKQQNMQKQLSNFSKNKKKMAPYDIKPTANPKIQPNLHFFLKDPNAKPPPQASIKIQTDEFKERPAPAAYKPKKTGINTATQIQQDELFNFEKEVRPIVWILTTKALETAALQIEEEQQLLKMAKYKAAYEERVRRQKEHEQKNIDQQLQLLREKEKLLSEHRDKDHARTKIHQRTQYYAIANNFLPNIYFQTTNKLITANAYPDSLTNHLALDYLNQVIAKAAFAYQKLVQNDVSLQRVFEKDVISNIKQSCKRPKAERQRAKRRLQARTINRTGNQRRVHILYRHDYQQFSNFSKHLSRHFEGSLQEHIRVRQQQIQETADKVQGGDVAEEELQKLKLKDSADFSNSGHSAFSLNNQREVCFMCTPNRYEKIADNYITNGLLFLDKEGEPNEELSFDKVPASQQTYVRRQSQLRQARESVNFDEGIVINLAKVPQNIRTIVLLSKLTDVQRFRTEIQAKKARYVTYGVQFWQRKVAIHQKNIGQAIKWQELVKVAEGEEPPSQSLLIVSYVLRRRTLPQYWNLEDVSYASQPIRNREEQNRFLDQLSRFYPHSLDYLKEEEDEERLERSISPEKKAPSNQGSRARSKKVIEQAPKKRIVLKVGTRILNQVEIDLDEGLPKAVSKLTNSVQEWKEFLQSCENGWELWFKGKKLTSLEQLQKFRKIGDLTVRKIPKVQEPKIEKVEQSALQKEQQQ